MRFCIHIGQNRNGYDSGTILREGRLEATRENILELLEDLGKIPEDLQTKLEDLEDLIKLKSLLKIAAKAESLRAFEEKAEIYFNPKDKK